MRRGTFREGTVDYAAVGATGAPDLMQYPPEKSIPAERSWRIGSGEDRFRTAGDALLTWTAYRASGLTVSDVRPPDTPAYAGVSFDAEGNAIAPSHQEQETRLDETGTPYAAAGTTVKVHGRAGRHRADAELRVISLVEEPRRVALVLGTIGGSVVSGEESFAIDWREDNDEVWFTVRAFDTPVTLWGRMLPATVRARRKALFDGYHRAISPLYNTPA